MELKAPLGRTGSRFVRVEGQDDPIREAGQLPDVFLAEGRAARRHGVSNTRLIEGDHVGIPLDHKGATRTGHLSLGPVQVIEQRALVVDGSVRRVDVLRRRPVSGQEPAAETHPIPGEIVNREHDPGPELIPQASRRVSAGKPGLHEQFR